MKGNLRCLRWRVLRQLMLMVLIGGPFLVCTAFAQNDTALAALLSDADAFHEKAVTIRGEVVGELLSDKDGWWVNIAEDGAHIGVFFDRPQMLNALRAFGSYRMRGDTVVITGIFYAHCPFHAERDIHATGIQVIERGVRLPDTVGVTKKRLSHMLTIICLTLSVLYLIKIRYARRNKTY